MRQVGRPPQHLRQPRTRRPLVSSLALLALAAGMLSWLHNFGSGDFRCVVLPWPWRLVHSRLRARTHPDRPGDSFADALKEIDLLSASVAKEGFIPDFGRRAAVILQSAHVPASSSNAEANALADNLDAPLEALFLRQLQTLVVQAVDLYDAEMEARPNPAHAGFAAQAFFDAGVAELRRPGSTWSAQAEREDLLLRLEESYARDVGLLAEQARRGQGKQITMQVVQKLQQQGLDVQRQVESRGALPWNVKWQYFLEDSPVGFRGQYDKGRSVLEMLLMPSPDPKQKDKLLNKIGPLNLAVAFDMLN